MKFAGNQSPCAKFVRGVIFMRRNTNELILLKLEGLERSIEHVREQVKDVREQVKEVRAEIRDVRNEMRSSIRHGQIITASVIGIALAVVYAVLR